MKGFTLLRFLALGMILLPIIVSCSGGSDSPSSPGLSDESNHPAAGIISLGIPIENGDEISIPVEFSEANDLYALSFRVGYDPLGLTPIGCEWSNVVGEEDSTFHLLNRRDFIPLAFARFSGMPGLAREGLLCTLKFRIRDPQKAACRVISDEAYLVAYNSLGERLILQAGGEVR